MKDPAGTTTRLLMTNGNAVSAYTASPSRAFLVEIACFSNKGILVPAGIVIAFGSEAAAGAGFAAAPAAGAELAAGGSGFCASAVCPNAIPDNSKNTHAPRITNLQSRQFSREYHASAARMLAFPPGVIQTLRSLRP